MRKTILILLVAIVPFMGIAQKRSKKKKNVLTEQSHNFMVIKGVEMIVELGGGHPDKKSMLRSNLIQLQNSSIMIYYDFGRGDSRESKDLREIEGIKSMTEAVNIAVRKGWTFNSANVIDAKGIRTHYYYMTKN